MNSSQYSEHRAFQEASLTLNLSIIALKFKALGFPLNRAIPSYIRKRRGSMREINHRGYGMLSSQRYRACIELTFSNIIFTQENYLKASNGS